MKSKIFINRLMIYPQLGKCDVNFRNGLNVIWSEDIIKGISLKENNLRNSVGKTTFVKFIDYLLGKNYFIKSIDSNKKELFEGKSLLAEVILGDNKFTIQRSVLENEKIIVYIGWVIDEIVLNQLDQKGEFFDADKYNEFLSKNIYGENIIINKKTYIKHRSIMSYLIREQSVGFIKYDSGLKEEKSKVRKRRLEFLLGLVSEDREQLEQDIDELEKEKAKYVNERSVLNKYFKLVSDTTLNKLNKDKAKNEKQIMHFETEITNKEKLFVELQEKNEKCKSVEDKLNKKLIAIDEEIYILNIKEKDYIMAVKDIDNELYKIKNINLSIDIFSSLEFKRCPIYMKELKGEKNSCDYMTENENKNQFKTIIEARKKILIFEKKDINNAINEVLKLIKELQKDKLRVAKELTNNKELQNKIKTDIEKQFDGVKEKIKDLKYQNNLIDKEIGHFNYINKLKEYIDNKNVIITEKKKALEEIIKSRAIELNAIYNTIVSYLTNNARIGKININTYAPGIYHPNGNIDKGAAMGNVAVIAFDLAMLELSLKFDEIDAVYPKFLVHDSPKLHDIQLDIYKRIMDYVISIENEYKKQNKEFQYILTTLDISDSVEKDKETYVKLTLDNSGDGGKLFGCQVEID